MTTATTTAVRLSPKHVDILAHRLEASDALADVFLETFCKTLWPVSGTDEQDALIDLCEKLHYYITTRNELPFNLMLDAMDGKLEPLFARHRKSHTPDDEHDYQSFPESISREILADCIDGSVYASAGCPDVWDKMTRAQKREFYRNVAAGEQLAKIMTAYGIPCEWSDN